MMADSCDSALLWVGQLGFATECRFFPDLRYCVQFRDYKRHEKWLLRSGNLTARSCKFTWIRFTFHYPSSESLMSKVGPSSTLFWQGPTHNVSLNREKFAPKKLQTSALTLIKHFEQYCYHAYLPDKLQISSSMMIIFNLLWYALQQLQPSIWSVIDCMC